MNIDEKNLVVRQSNELIEASYKIASIGEGRLIRMLIAQITPNDEDFKTYRIGVSDFARFFGLSKGSNSVYELIKKSADELAGRRIMLEKDGSWLRLNWLSYAEYKKGSGHIEVRFDKALKPYLLGLKGYFTQYELENVVKFKSGYAMRLFELLKMEQFKADDKGYFKRSFEYEELRGVLGIDKKEYEFFKDFRVYVVQIAVKEINANPDITILQVDYPKTGRKVSHIVFHCERARQTQLDLDEPPPKFEEVPGKKEHPEYIAELIAIGIDEKTAYRWKRKYSVAQLQQAITYTKAMQKAGKIRDSLTGFLARAVTDNIGASWALAEKKAIDNKKRQEEKENGAKKEDEETSKRQRDNRAKALDLFKAISETEQQVLIDKYLENAGNLEKLNFEKRGIKETIFAIFLVKHFKI